MCEMLSLWLLIVCFGTQLAQISAKETRFDYVIAIQEDVLEYRLSFPDFHEINGPFTKIQVQANTAAQFPRSLLKIASIVMESHCPGIEAHVQKTVFHMVGGGPFKPDIGWTARSYFMILSDLNKLNEVWRMPVLSSYFIILRLNKRLRLKRYGNVEIWITIAATPYVESSEEAGPSNAYNRAPTLADQVIPQAQYQNVGSSNMYHQALDRAPIFQDHRTSQGLYEVMTNTLDEYLASRSLANPPVQSLPFPASMRSDPLLHMLATYNINIGDYSPWLALPSGLFPDSIEKITEFKVTIGRLPNHRAKDISLDVLEHISCFVEWSLNGKIETRGLTAQAVEANSVDHRLLRSYYLDSSTLTIIAQLQLRQVMVVLDFQRHVESREAMMHGDYALAAYSSIRYWPRGKEEFIAGSSFA